jgi:hypothetical protein
MMRSVDHRVSRTDVEGHDEFDRLQTLHEAAVDCLGGRLEELTPGMRALTVLFAFAGEIDNGGFAACMYNSTGDFTGEAITAARRVGADEHAELFERFVQVGLRGDLTMDHTAREQRLDAMDDADEKTLEELDDQFYALRPIDDFLSAYVNQKPAEFFKD